MSPDLLLQIAIVFFGAFASGAAVYAAIKADLTRAIILAERASVEADKAHERISNHVEVHHTN